MNVNLTCRLQEDEETSAVGSDLEEEEEEVQQLILAIGSGTKPFEGYPEITSVSQSIPKSIFKTHVTIAIFLYYTIAFIITALNIKTSRLQVDSRRWLVEEPNRERR